LEKAGFSNPAFSTHRREAMPFNTHAYYFPKAITTAKINLSEEIVEFKSVVAAPPSATEPISENSADFSEQFGRARRGLSQAERVREMVDAIYRSESRRVRATLVRLLGDFDLAEDALHDAFRAALEQWPRDGVVPTNPRAWLVSTGRFKAIDSMRRRARFNALQTEFVERLYAEASDAVELDDENVEDDQLRLIFTCCHPALSPEARMALTLREVCGLTTEEIARAFLTTPSTLAQRIVRAKAKIRDARIPYQVPSQIELPERLDTVLHVIYLVFNEGYSASFGESLTRSELSSEAIRLGRLLVELLPEPEVMGLLALMLLHESRRAARTSPEGDLILLEDQDRSLWNRDQIVEGLALVERALSSHRFSSYTIQAAIAAVHAQASNPAATDWAQIVGLYDLLLRMAPSPVIELNRAAAVAMRDGPWAGLALIDAILARGDLAEYQLAHSARAELCRRLGRTAEARASYERALSLTRLEPERRFLERRLAELKG
jgi:RNA polymerase sigma-70 factor (ECF subfamily)